MHELSLVNNVIDIVEEYAAKEGFRRVNSLKLSYGRLSGIEPSALQFAFEIQAKGTKMEGASLIFEVKPPIIYCTLCAKEYEIDPYTLECPSCKGSEVMLTCGTESLHLLEMDVD